MSTSKSLDTDFLSSEKRSLFRFSILYILLSIIIISAFSFMYYDAQKKLMLQAKKPLLEEYSKTLIQDLKELHRDFDKRQNYPRYEDFESAIYDNEKKHIFSSSFIRLNVHKILYLENSKIHLVNIPESYYLGAKYIVIQVQDDAIWFRQTLEKVTLLSLVAFIVMLGIGYLLLRQFLKPMREAIELLDRFIKDTTHELNTPVSTIVTNIEMIDTKTLDANLARKINRIDIGAKTISNIYQDLTYLTLDYKIISNDESLDIQALLQERVEYFKSLAQAKKVSLDIQVLSPSTLTMDKAKCSKLFDNLLSNAIKYNRLDGSIVVVIERRKVSVQDTGIGIASEDIEKMQERYTRFNTSSGGFGIGLNIVSRIAKEYTLTIDIDSKLHTGTKVSVSW